MNQNIPPRSPKKRSVADVVWDLASPVAEELGYILWDVDFSKEGADLVLHIVIDSERAGGIGIEDCEAMSGRMSALLDENDPIEDAYILSISSPGVERTLTRPAHFARFLGQRVTAKLYTPVNGVRIYEGSLVSRDDNGDVTLDLGDSTVTLPKKSISKIDTWYDWANDKPEKADPNTEAEATETTTEE